MRLILITCYKLKMMLNDRLFFAAMVIIPLFITLATGYALRYEKNNSIPIAIVDEDGSSYSNALAKRLGRKEGIKIQPTDRIKASEMLKANKIEAAFIIKQGFEEKIKLGESRGIIDMAKSPASFSAAFISEVISGEVLRLTCAHMAADWVEKQYKKLNKGFDSELEAEIIRHVDSQWEPKPLMTIEYMEMEGKQARKVERASMPAASATSAGIITVFIMFYVLFGSGWLIEERRNGTLKRLVCGQGALGHSFMANICALAVSGVFQLSLFSLLNKAAFGVELFPGVFSYAVFIAYLFAVIAISMFLSSILKTLAQLQAGAPVFALLTGFAGGCFWNYVEMSKEVRQLAMFTPQGWALFGINSLLLNPDDINAVILSAGVLLTIALILLPLSYIIVREQVKH
ncbi:MAG: ABC transporter permease [Clostridia bacterium]|nr:ABC transporter permease [Clostridia bacterium]